MGRWVAGIAAASTIQGTVMLGEYSDAMAHVILDCEYNEDLRSDGKGAAQLDVAGAAPNVFRQEGEYWTVIYDGVVCRLRDSKGLHHLAYLLRHPGTKVSALQLVTRRESSATECGSAVERARLTVTKGIKTALSRIEAAHPMLAQHLQATIHRGYLCSYVPDPRLPIKWEV